MLIPFTLPRFNWQLKGQHTHLLPCPGTPGLMHRKACCPLPAQTRCLTALHMFAGHTGLHLPQPAWWHLRLWEGALLLLQLPAGPCGCTVLAAAAAACLQAQQPVGACCTPSLTSLCALRWNRHALQQSHSTSRTCKEAPTKEAVSKFEGRTRQLLYYCCTRVPLAVHFLPSDSVMMLLILGRHHAAVASRNIGTSSWPNTIGPA